MIRTLEQTDVAGKQVLCRVDFNVPLEDGRIRHDARIQAVLPTLRYLKQQQATTLIVSHLGRPQEGEVLTKDSLAPIAEHLTQLLGQSVRLIHSLDSIELESNEIALLENVRCFKGEKSNDSHFAQRLAASFDVFVMDAFSAAHRAHASTAGVAHWVQDSCAGLLMEKEYLAIQRAVEAAKSPCVAIVGGSKVSTKFQVLENLIDKVDTLIVGGGMANTFLMAQGYPIGQSLAEPSWCEQARALMDKAHHQGKTLFIPEDVVCAKNLESNSPAQVYTVDKIPEQMSIFDVGPQSIQRIEQELARAQTILWNGPLGVFEVEPFDKGTCQLAQSVAQSSAYSVAGGGDTLAAIAKTGIGEQIDYQSHAGGAFLEYLEGKALPGLQPLLLAKSTLSES